jgi:class 3 adenylate cyclase
LEALSKKLSKYLSPQVYSSIFSGSKEVKIASSRKKLTVFFSDIADFTATTEDLESEELTTVLNHYLTEMSEIALAHGATIDKYIGDAILAFFGDPETKGVKEDGMACVNMAIAMQERMRELLMECATEVCRSRSGCASVSIPATAPSAISVVRTAWTIQLSAAR